MKNASRDPFSVLSPASSIPSPSHVGKRGPASKRETIWKTMFKDKSFKEIGGKRGKLSNISLIDWKKCTHTAAGGTQWHWLYNLSFDVNFSSQSFWEEINLIRVPKLDLSDILSSLQSSSNVGVIEWLVRQFKVNYARESLDSASQKTFCEKKGIQILFLWLILENGFLRNKLSLTVMSTRILYFRSFVQSEGTILLWEEKLQWMYQEN